MVPIGFAIPSPAMSGADPWIGSYSPRRTAAPPAESSSPKEAEGKTPSDPASIDASSVRMSPNMFSVTMTSKLRGSRNSIIAHASTST